MEEYGYAIITPYGFIKNVHNKIIQYLMKESFSSDLRTLISVYDINDEELARLVNISKKNYNLEVKKQGSTSSVTVLLVKGTDATNKLKKIVKDVEDKLQDESNLLKVYVSNNSEQAVEDLCEYFDLEGFDKLEQYLFDNSNQSITSFNFKALNEIKTK